LFRYAAICYIEKNKNKKVLALNENIFKPALNEFSNSETEKKPWLKIT